jgi:surface antigen
LVGGAGRMSDSRVGVGDELVMRTFRCNAPIIIGAGALVFLSVAPAPSLLKAEDRQAEPAVSDNPRAGAGSGGDRIVALKALALALSELGDGTTLVWQRPGRGLVGRVKPVSAFRDAKGRICRTVVYALALGGYQREIEGVACREQDGSWSLAG